MNRKHLLTILKINGVDETASDEEIHHILLSSKYTESEIDAALIILRSSKIEHGTRVEGLRSITCRDATLSSREVRNLLGIDSEIKVPLSSRSIHNTISREDAFMIIGLSLALATVTVLSYMFFYKVGFFYPSL